MAPEYVYAWCLSFGTEIRDVLLGKLVESAMCNKQTNKNLRCGNRKGLLSRNDQTHHRMGPKTMESIPPSKRNKQTNKQELAR